MAAGALSGPRSPVTQCQPPLVDTDRAARRSALWNSACGEPGRNRSRLLVARNLLACALSSPTPPRVGKQRALRPGSASAVRWLGPDHVRISAAVADAPDAGDVSVLGVDVCEAGVRGRARRAA